MTATACWWRVVVSPTFDQSCRATHRRIDPDQPGPKLRATANPRKPWCPAGVKLRWHGMPDASWWLMVAPVRSKSLRFLVGMLTVPRSVLGSLGFLALQPSQADTRRQTPWLSCFHGRCAVAHHTLRPRRFRPQFNRFGCPSLPYQSTVRPLMLTVTARGSLNWSNDSMPVSRPTPLSLKPPQGEAGSRR